MGDIKIFFDLISTRGMAFITYYDLRAATMAKEKLQGTDVSGRPIDVHYSLPKDNELERRCDRDKNQATLLLSITGTHRVVSDGELRAKFEAYGEIRSIKPFKDSPHQRFIEYWDSRACEQAYDDLVDSPYLGGKLALKFSWDSGMVPKARLSSDWREGEEDDKEYPYNYEDDDYDQDDSYHHDDHDEARNKFGSNDRYPTTGPSYPNSSTNGNSISSFGNEIDEKRLDQAHKVQELLASLTKTGTETNSSVGQVPLVTNVLNNYPTDGSLSKSSSQSTYMPSVMPTIPTPNNFVPNYPTYPPTVASNNSANLSAHANNPSAPNYNQLAQIMGQLSNMSSATHSPSNAQGQIPSTSYPQLNDVQQRNLSALLGNQNNKPPPVPQSGLSLPSSVLALLQRSGATNPGSIPMNQPSQSNPYQLPKPTPAPSPAIPTAPRAMQALAKLSNPSSAAQVGTSILPSMPRSSAGSSMITPPIGPSHTIPPSQPNNLSVVNPTSSYNLTIPTASTYPSNPQAAVQQLLALLQQQQQQQQQQQPS